MSEADVDVVLVSADPGGVTIRNQDGREQYVRGQDIICVYCQPGEVRRHLAGGECDLELRGVMHASGKLSILASLLHA